MPDDEREPAEHGAVGAERTLTVPLHPQPPAALTGLGRRRQPVVAARLGEGEHLLAPVVVRDIVEVVVVEPRRVGMPEPPGDHVVLASEDPAALEHDVDS